MRLPEVLKRSYHPVREIEWAIVFVSLLQALYVVSPLYDHAVATNGLTPFVAGLAHPALIYVFAAGLVISSAILAYGIIKNIPNIRSNGLFLQFLLRLFNALTTVLAAGFLPLYWFHSLAVLCVVTILWASERSLMYRDA